MEAGIHVRASIISEHSTSFFVPFTADITQDNILLKKRKIMIAL